MEKENKDKFYVSDNEGRLIDLPAGSFREDETDEMAKDILRKASIFKKFFLTEPNENFELYFYEDLIEQYTFFRNNISNPNRVFYPCCELDASPIKGFPNSEVILMDKEKYVKKAMKKNKIKNFIHKDVLKYNPKNPFDLVILLNPYLSSKDLTKHLHNGGYVLANNWHNNASQLLENSEFEGVGTIDKNKNGIYLAKGDFSKIEPNQSATYFYVFKKL